MVEHPMQSQLVKHHLTSASTGRLLAAGDPHVS